MVKFLKKSWIALGIITSLGLVIAVGLISYYSLQNLREDQKWVERSIESIDETNNLMKIIVDAETSLRGFIIISEEDFLTRYKQSIPKIKIQSENLKTIFINNANQYKKVVVLKQLIDERLRIFNLVLADINKKDYEINSNQIVLLKLGKQKMDEVRAKVDEIVDAENVLLKKRRADSDISNQRTINIIFFGTLLIIVIVAVLFAFIKKTFKNQIKAQNELFQTNIGLEKLFKENEEKTWLIAGSSVIDDAMRGAQDVSLRANNLVCEIAKYVGAEMAVMYLVNEENESSLNKIASYASSSFDKESFLLSKNVIEQVAIDKKRKIWDNTPDDDNKLTSGLGNTKSKYQLIEPILFQSDLKAVLELEFINPIPAKVLSLLDITNSIIGIGINVSQDRVMMKNLIEETQLLAEELQSQQEELQTTNEELLFKTQMLQSSEEELRVQQEELKDINSELEEKAQTLEEKNKVIDEAREAVFIKMEELQISGKYKSEFLANMSHELRTPLNSILILARILKDNKDNHLSKDEAKYANVIYKAGNDLLSIINDILDLAKIESGKFDFNFEKVSVSEIKEDLHQFFDELAKNSNINFNVQVDAKLPQKIEIDKLRVEQIIRNLLSNAFKFTSKNGDINVLFKSEDGDLIKIEVNDNGIGIPLNKQKVIFEAFQQADGSTSRKFGGTGLGLSISKELAQRMNGKITLESEEGKGSIFSLIIPTKVITNFNNDAIKIEPIKERFIELNLPKFNPDTDRAKDLRSKPLVMIVEDDIFLNNFLKEYVNKKGFIAIQAYDGESAISEAIKQLPDAILLDIMLPGIDGWGVLKRLKSEFVTQAIPVHMMSGGEQKELKAIHAGAVSFIKKPLEKDALDKIFSDLIPSDELKYKSILLVEDKQIESEVIAKLFKNKNINVKQAYTGEKGLEFLEKENFDCLILDINLPDISGFEFLERIKIDKRFKDMPVIINTSMDLSQEDMNKLISHANATVMKSSKSSDRLIDEVNLFLHKLKKENLKTNDLKPVSFSTIKSTKSKTILLVDDDMRNIFAISAVLDSNGYKIEIANNGLEALKKIEEIKSIDLILMDIMMPEMDGLEAMRQIRLNPLKDKLPIIALTAKAMKEDKDQCILAGANEYVTKPVDTNKLLALLKIWLD